MSVQFNPTIAANTNATLQAGSAIVGKIGIDQTTPGTTNLVENVNVPQNIQVTPTVTASAYSAGNALGGLQTLTNAMRISSGSALLRSLSVTDKGNQKPALDIMFFNAPPTAPTDHAAYTTLATDILKLVGRVLVASGDWDTVNSVGLATLKSLGLLMAAAATANLWVIVVTSGTPTPASTSDYTFTYQFEQN